MFIILYKKRPNQRSFLYFGRAHPGLPGLFIFLNFYFAKGAVRTPELNLFIRLSLHGVNYFY